MFKDNKNFKKIDEEIYIWENFISDKQLNFFNDIANSITEEEWLKHQNNNIFWNGKISLEKKELYLIHNKITKILSPEYVIPIKLNLNRTPLGQGMHVHKDRGDLGYIPNDDLGHSHLIDYGLLLYFGNWENGQIYYPNRNIEIKPNAGDLIIHGALKDYEHGVKPVTSGKRFFYANFIIPSNLPYRNLITNQMHTGPYYIDMENI